jgi:choline dehydrogenase
MSSRRQKAANGAPAAETLIERRWDYIIVGGGSAGCVLARRLSEDPWASVLLVEAGGTVHDRAVLLPSAWPTLAGGNYDWNYQSSAQVGLNGRRPNQPRGKGLGGSTLINAMGFQRGASEAYDSWGRETGDHGWSSEGLLPYFRKLETASGGANRFRGGDGPMHVLQLNNVDDRHPLALAIAEAGVAAGHAPNDDWNGARADGTIWSQLTIKNGLRDTAASAFLDPARDRPNLGILTGALVTRLTVKGTRCVGIELNCDGRNHRLAATEETILCAGAFDTPRLLMLSGVGDTAMLETAGVKVVHHLVGVGSNLHDHPLMPGLLYQSPRPLAASRYNHCESIVVAESQHSPGWADLMIMGLSVPFLSPLLGPPPVNTFSLVPALTYPRSRGSIKILSSNPAHPAAIDPGYLRNPLDVDALVDGIEIARAMAATNPLRRWISKEVFPGPAVRTRSALAAHIRSVASPFFHPVSTCAMGRADSINAVVDPSCRVRGIDNLRIADASIFPSIPQAMTNAAVFAVAERAADIIRTR